MQHIRSAPLFLLDEISYSRAVSKGFETPSRSFFAMFPATLKNDVRSTGDGFIFANSKPLGLMKPL